MSLTESGCSSCTEVFISIPWPGFESLAFAVIVTSGGWLGGGAITFTVTSLVAV